MSDLVGPELLGYKAFRAYCLSVGGCAHDGAPIPDWDSLGDSVQGGWIEAGRAAVQHALGVGIQRVITELRGDDDDAQEQ